MTPAPAAGVSLTDRLLTDAELPLMTILWETGGGTVREVLERLPADRPLAYTTVSTTLRILEGRGYVTTRKEGRTHVYLPAVEKPGYEKRWLRHLLGGLFGGDRLALVRELIDSEPVDEEELQALQALLDDKLGGGS